MVEGEKDQDRNLSKLQFVAGGHFVWDIMVKYFSNPLYNKAILDTSAIILLDSYW